MAGLPLSSQLDILSQDLRFSYFERAVRQDDRAACDAGDGIVVISNPLK